MWGRAAPAWWSRTREIYPRSVHTGARAPTVWSRGSPLESQSPAPPDSPTCWSPPTPERPLAPQTRTGEPRWGLRTSLGCSPPLRLPKEILRLCGALFTVYLRMKLSASKGYRGGPGCTPALSLLLGSFLDLDYLLRYQPVSLPVDRFRRFFVWGFGKAEDLARLLVVPVPVILDPVFVLDFEVLLVGLGHRFCGKPFNPLVVLHEEWHSTDSPFSHFPQRVVHTWTISGSRI